MQVKSELRSKPSALNSIIDIWIINEAIIESTIVAISICGGQELRKLLILVSISSDRDHKSHKGKENEKTYAVCALSLFYRAVF